MKKNLKHIVVIILCIVQCMGIKSIYATENCGYIQRNKESLSILSEEKAFTTARVKLSI